MQFKENYKYWEAEKENVFPSFRKILGNNWVGWGGGGWRII